jgi:hypothetical protein
VVTYTSPGSDALTAGIGIAVTVTSHLPIEAVQLLLDDRIVGTILTPPFATTTDATMFPVGAHVLRAFARDAEGRIGTAQLAIRLAESCGNGVAQGTE